MINLKIDTHYQVQRYTSDTLDKYDRNRSTQISKQITSDLLNDSMVNSRRTDRKVCYTSFQFVFPVTEAQIFALSLYNNRTVLVSFF